MIEKASLVFEESREPYNIIFIGFFGEPRDGGTGLVSSGLVRELFYSGGILITPHLRLPHTQRGIEYMSIVVYNTCLDVWYQMVLKVIV